MDIFKPQGFPGVQWRHHGIALDYFYQPHRVKYFFLTHIHSDHLRGLNAQFSQVIHGTPETQVLLSAKYPYISFHALTPGAWHSVGHFQVFVVPTSHCLGSCMYWFQFAAETWLFTGDFCGTPWKPYRHQLPPQIQWAFVDTTMDDARLIFPTRTQVVRMLTSLVARYPEGIQCSVHTVGLEQIVNDCQFAVESRVTFVPESTSGKHPGLLRVCWDHQVDPDQPRVKLGVRWFLQHHCMSAGCVKPQWDPEHKVWHILYNMHASRRDLDQLRQDFRITDMVANDCAILISPTIAEKKKDG